MEAIWDENKSSCLRLKHLLWPGWLRIYTSFVCCSVTNPNNEWHARSCIHAFVTLKTLVCLSCQTLVPNVHHNASSQLLMVQNRQEGSSYVKGPEEHLLLHKCYQGPVSIQVFALAHVCFLTVAVAHPRPSSQRRTSQRAPISMNCWNMPRPHWAVETWGRLWCCLKERISMNGLLSTVSGWLHFTS